MPHIQTIHHTNIPFHWQYQPVKKEFFHPDGGTYFSYGLQVYRCQNQLREPVAYIDDISVCQNFVEDLALRFTVHQLSPVHLHDAVIDALP